jgi:hypothetical protein
MYTATARIYQNQQHTKSILAKGKKRTRASEKMEKEKRDRDIKVTISWPFIEEREQYMKQGLCFRCHKTGHCIQDYNADGFLKQGTYQKLASRKFEPRKTSTQVYANIQTMMTILTEEKRENCIRTIEEQGL